MVDVKLLPCSHPQSRYGIMAALRIPTGREYTELYELKLDVDDREMWRWNLLAVLKSRRRTKAGELHFITGSSEPS
ncbi:hypothetical protein N7450_011426 [Penicillium hetheringtonii]|uniref:Uncharacterized protein n=1 Tax=Penicillium hetheringtonii TaxID=911720 RepID=A0AAD6GNA7_9EURO|nr:hypothetical protein N7450_011426 [Penicillium hetheringtonii]